MTGSGYFELCNLFVDAADVIGIYSALVSKVSTRQSHDIPVSIDCETLL